MNEQAKTIDRDILSAAVLLLLAAGIWLLSSRFPNLPEGYPGPKLFPRIIAVGLGLIGLIVGMSRFLRPRTEAPVVEKVIAEKEDKSPLRLLLGVALLAVFPWLSPLIGFIPTLFATGALMGMCLQVVWWRSIITAAITVGMIYLIFSGLLNVPL